MTGLTEKHNGRNQQPDRGKDSLLLGDVLGRMMEDRLGNRHEQTVLLQQAWAEILPPELAEHCRIDEFSTGRLTVVVDGPGYMHEMRLCKKDLCAEVSRTVPGLSVRDIKLVVGK